MPFGITEADVRAVFPADGKCPVLGIPLGSGAAAPSLDRLIPTWGYQKGNIAVISNRANKLKNDGTAREHAAVAEWMRSQGLD